MKLNPVNSNASDENEPQPLNGSAFGELGTVQPVPLTGWAFTYNLNPGVVNQIIESSGIITNDKGHAVLNTGASADGKAEITTVRSSRYIPGVGGYARFTAVFSSPQENSQQIIGLINGKDGWAFGYEGLKFGIVRKSDNVENWIYQDDWNIDKKVNFDPTKGNVFQIKYQWLGYGMQFFYMEDENGNLELVHKIQYNNKFTETSILNPNLPLSAYVVNTGNTTPISLKTPSAIAGLEGDAFNDAISTNVSGDNIIAIGTAVTDFPILSFRMMDLYYAKSNRLFCQLLRAMFASEGNKTVLFRVYYGGTVIGGSWDYLEEELSPLEVNTTMTDYTLGTKLGAFPLGKADSLMVDLIASKVRLYANQTLTVTVTTQGASDITTALNWKSFV